MQNFKNKFINEVIKINLLDIEKDYKDRRRCTFILGSDILHSFANSPSEIFIYINNTDIIFDRYWHYMGMLHRDYDEPAHISYKNYIKYILYWYRYDKFHRDNDKPAIISYYENGNISYEKYYINGVLHRDNDKPAIIRYYENGNIKSKVWYINGKVGRLYAGNPNVIIYDIDGKIIKLI